METIQTVVDVLKRESEANAASADLSGLEQRLHGLQAEAAGQALELSETRVKLAAEAARNEELRQQITCLGQCCRIRPAPRYFQLYCMHFKNI